MNKPITKIVGYVLKDPFDGDINGRHITSPAKVVFHIETSNVPDHHGIAVDTIVLPLEKAKAMNNGSDNFDSYIGCSVRLEYMVYNGRQQLVDIEILKKQ